MKWISRVIVFLAAALISGTLFGEEKAFKAEVWDLYGPATYSVGSGPPREIRVSTTIPAGAVIKTGPAAALDLQLERGGLVRLTQNTTLSLDKLTIIDQPERTIDVQLTLSQGTILGRLNKLPAAGKFEVKISNGVVGVREGQYRINSEGYLVLLTGSMLFAYVPRSGQPVLYTLNGPPPLYFSPLEGVKSAPPVLVKEVQGQLRPTLRGP